MRISRIFLFYLAKKNDNHVNLTVIPEIQQYLTNKILHQIKQNLPLPPLHGQINLTEFVEINFIMHTAKFETFLFVQISLINFSNLLNSLYKKQPIKIQITTCKKKNYEHKTPNKETQKLKLFNSNLLLKCLSRI